MTTGLFPGLGWDRGLGAGSLGSSVARRTQFRLLVAISLTWLVWAGWSMLDTNEPLILRVVDDVGDPVENAAVSTRGSQLGITGEDGRLTIPVRGDLIEVTAPGHVAATITLIRPESGVLDAVLKAQVLRGRVVDDKGSPVSGAEVAAGRASAETDDDGRFVLRGAEVGDVTVSRPAWDPTSFSWEGGPGETQIELAPTELKAVHISGEAIEERFDEFLDLVDTTELNALMIDLKDESGLVLYETGVATVAEVGADFPYYDLADVVETARQRDLYVIGRLVTFQDPIAARALPEMSVWDEATNAPLESRNQYFLDPTDPDARAYALAIAEEACAMGVDEIQFDYVRFPDSRPESARFDGGVTIDIRAETIRGFLLEAAEVLHPMGCAVGVDVFGFVTTATDDGGIGQRWEDITSAVDVVSPMLYPSHYDVGWYGFESPSDNPGGVIDQALADALERLSRNVVVRPWLQDFGYTDEQVRAQIEMAEKHGLGWMLWNATSEVTTGALDQE